MSCGREAGSRFLRGARERFSNSGDREKPVRERVDSTCAQQDFVRSIARRVTVLHEGQVLADGPMTQIQNDPRVIEVYLGE